MQSRVVANPYEDRLGKAIGISVVLHLIAIAAFTLKAVFYPSEPLILEETIRVDIVALPDKSVKSLPPMPVEQPKPVEAQPKPEPVVEQPKPEPVKPVEVAKPVPVKPAPPKPETPAVNLNKAKQDQQAAIKRLEALQKIETMMKNSQAAPKPQVQPAQVKGNEVSNGASLRGLAKLEHQNYLRTIDGSVKSNWALPGWLAKSNLSAKVRLFIDSNGAVIKRSITKSSNNEVFDSKALAAIDAASPLPAPPASLAGVLSVDGVELEFVPE